MERPLRASRTILRLPSAEVPLMAGASLILVYLAVVPVATMIYASVQSGFLATTRTGRSPTTRSSSPRPASPR